MDDLDGDPGWRVSPGMLLFLVPGYLRLAARRADRTDGLTLVRQVWLTFLGATILFGGVILMIIPGSATTPELPWVATLVVVSVACLAAESWALGRPLAGDTLRDVAGSFRARFFLAIAFADAIALFAFTFTFVTGRWWVYWLFWPLAAVGFMRNAPTPSYLKSEQRRLDDAGSELSLVRALRTPSA